MRGRPRAIVEELERLRGEVASLLREIAALKNDIEAGDGELMVLRHLVATGRLPQPASPRAVQKFVHREGRA